MTRTTKPTAAYWSPEMPLLVSKRQKIPDVESLQDTYVRYRNSERALSLTDGWQKAASLSASHGDAAAAASLAPAPESISMEIIQAPAEFAVPVKQDKHFKTTFKVRMSMSSSSETALPINVQAHAISQPEYDRIDTWIPPEMAAFQTSQMVERTVPTDLKGKLKLSWYFDMTPPQSRTPPQLGSRPAGQSQTSMSLTLSGLGDVTDADLPSLPFSSNWEYDRNQEDFLTLFASEHGAAASDMSSALGYGGAGVASTHGPDNTANSASAAAPEMMHISHDFEWSDLEFARPSRMERVYILFCCQIADMDIMYTVFRVPTVCICRREQKEKAYMKLGIPYMTLHEEPDKSRGGAARAVEADKRSPKRRGHGGGARSAEASSLAAKGECDFSIFDPRPSAPGPSAKHSMDDCMDQVAMICAIGELQDDLPAFPLEFHTAEDVKEHILDSYSAIGMLRRLTNQDLSALLALAGFPQMGDPDVGKALITKEQFQDFQAGWQSMLLLLQKIHHCWNADDPHVVCGFEVDHFCAVNALCGEPPGTFLCRFSLSQPGCVVLVCKVHANAPNSDGNGLVHALLNVGDLQERRVDKWIVDFPGATHLLDVYTTRRVDKRVAFHAGYSALRDIGRRPDIAATPLPAVSA